jgi:hypothetical protein
MLVKNLIYGSSKNCFFFVGLQFLKLPAVRASPFSFTPVNSGFKSLVRLEKSNFWKPP